jgi:hypothetical protein
LKLAIVQLLLRSLLFEVLAQHDQGCLDPHEAFIDGSLAPAKEGGGYGKALIVLS